MPITHPNHHLTILRYPMQKNKYLTIGLLSMLSMLAISSQAAVSLQPIAQKLTQPANWNWQTFNNLPKTTSYQKGLQNNPKYMTKNF